MKTITEYDLYHPSLASAVVKAFGLCAALTIVTGLLYPMAVTGVGQAVFPEKANGSLIVAEGAVAPVGSALIGQSFEGTPFFKGRPAATPNPTVSGGTNRGALHPDLKAFSEEKVAHWQRLKGSDEPVPLDLVTQSASGLDPHISREAARWQVPIVARDTGLDEKTLLALVDAADEKGLFGRHHYVNVLELNLKVKALLEEPRG